MNSKRKILVVVDSINIDDSSGSKANVAFIESFRNAGYVVTVLHYTQKIINLSGVKCYAIKEKKGTINYILSRFQRLLFRWFKIDISKYVDSLFGFSFGFFNDVYSISKELRKYNPDNFDMVWTFGKGTSFRAHAALLKNSKWFHLWFAFVHDPYPKHLYPRPYNFVEYGFKKKRNFFRDITIKAHRMVFPSKLLKEWMQSYFVDVKDKSLVIPHQTVTNKVGKNVLPNYFNTSKFNVLQAGNLLDLRDPRPIIVAYEKFLVAVPSAKKDSTLLFLGKKSIFQEYLLQKQKKIPQLFISDGYVNFVDVYTMQKNAAINIILEATSEISPFLPGKFPHCVAANKPILVVGPYYSECKRLLGEKYPYVYDFNEVEGITEALKELYINWRDNNNNNNNNNNATSLNRPDLEYYLSSDYLKEVIEGL